MGRPLFSTLYHTPPKVEEPATPCPYEKWSHANPFDPDADDALNSEDVVYEAFLDDLASAAHRVAVGDVDTDGEPHSDDELGVRVEVRVEGGEQVLVIGTARSSRTTASSPMSSQESFGDNPVVRASPMAVGADDPAHLIDDAYRHLNLDGISPATGDNQPGPFPQGSPSSRPVPIVQPQWMYIHPEMAEIMNNTMQRIHAGTAELRARLLSTPAATMYGVGRNPAHADEVSMRRESPANNFSNTQHVPRGPRPRVALHDTSVASQTSMPALRSPSTPPRQPLSRRSEASPVSPLFRPRSPSPPPIVTPRIYSWSSHPSYVPRAVGSPSPSPSASFYSRLGPPNHGGGRFHTHIESAHSSPTIIRTHT